MRRLALAFIFSALAFAVTQSGHTAEPLPSIALLAIGDFGTGGSREQEIGAAMHRFEAQSPANVLVTLGDNDYTESPSAFATNWTSAFGWLGPAGVSVAGSLGNHDVKVDNGRYEFRLLNMPGPIYRRKLGLVELFVLNSNTVNEAQRQWLARALRSSRARWKVAVFHHPVYSCGFYRSHAAIVRQWVPLFERHRVRLVLNGHDHNYQRFGPRRGVTYVVHGGGGAFSYDIKRCPAGYPRRVRAREERGWLYFVFDQARATGWTVDMTGRRTDRFTLAP